MIHIIDAMSTIHAYPGTSSMRNPQVYVDGDCVFITGRDFIRPENTSFLFDLVENQDLSRFPGEVMEITNLIQTAEDTRLSELDKALALCIQAVYRKVILAPSQVEQGFRSMGLDLGKYKLEMNYITGGIVPKYQGPDAQEETIEAFLRQVGWIDPW